MIAIDLDDGMKVDYARFQSALAKSNERIEL